MHQASRYCVCSLKVVGGAEMYFDRSDGSTAVRTLECGGDPRPAGAPAASAQTPRSDVNSKRSLSPPRSSRGGGGGRGEPVPLSWRRTKHIYPLDSLGAFQTRSTFHLPRRTSSGYFSSSDGGSLTSSPNSPGPQTADRSTQTPSPNSQVMQHALQRMGAHGGGPGAHLQHGHSSSSSSPWTPPAAEDMETEAIGRELRRIGDDYNRLLLLRRMPGRHRRVVVHPNPPAFIHQEPAVLLCVSLLLLLIGRIIFLHGNTESRDHSQV